MDQNDGGNAKDVHGRPLGRGLEDVSHLFLSPKTGDVPTRTGAPALSSEAESCAALLRPAHVTRDRLAAILPPDWSGALEDGLRAIDAKMPCHPFGEIDVLAVDRTGRLTIIDFETTPNDSLLLRGLGHVDWILRNTQAVQRMCPGQAFDASLTPRLILLAPQFSPLLRRLMRQLTRPQIHWVRYHAVETPAGPGILFEPVAGE
jgi:hypothetical protein